MIEVNGIGNLAEVLERCLCQLSRQPAIVVRGQRNQGGEEGDRKDITRRHVQDKHGPRNGQKLPGRLEGRRKTRKVPAIPGDDHADQKT